HFNRAEVYALQFQPHNALPYYEKAYRYRPDNVQYASQYARTLQQQHSYATAQMVYQEVLATFRQLAQANPPAYLPNVAMALNNLGNLYSDTQRLSEAEQAYQEALTIRRQLAQANPPAYLPNVATTLTNLGTLKLGLKDLDKAQTLIAEALIIRRVLWKQHAAAYGNDLALSLGDR